MFFENYFHKAPALFYGLALYLGFSIGFGQIWPIMLAIIILVVSGKRRIMILILMFSAFCFTKMYYQFPKDEVINGTAHISITSMKPYRTSFSKGVAYSGTIKWLYSEKGIVAKNIPFVLKANQQSPANQDYLVKGSLKKNRFGGFCFFVKKGEAWHPVSNTWSLAEWRYQSKMKLKKLISKRIASEKSAAFLSGIATGIFDDTQMVHEFSRFGLQHIMAISGFHFALVALFISMALKSILPERKAAATIVLLLTSYFVFLGTSPSIFRAWIMAIIYFLSILFQKQNRPINSLGISAIAILLLDPLSSQNLGFQFSFLVTASILIFHQPIDLLLQRFFAKRPLSELAKMDRLNQHGYVFSSLLRQNFALTLAVQLVAVPLILFVTHKFPLMSLFYNLFFPFLVSISIFLLIMGLITGLAFIYSLNSIYTDFVLNLTYGLPTSFDFWVRVESFPTLVLACYLCFLFLIAIYLRQWLDEKQLSKQDLAYL